MSTQQLSNTTTYREIKFSRQRQRRIKRDRETEDKETKDREIEREKERDTETDRARDRPVTDACYAALAKLHHITGERARLV